MSFHEVTLSSRSHKLTVRNIDFHYLEWGSPESPPLLLIHGGSAHAHWWDHIAVELAQEYRVLALDSRGHGNSDWVKPPAYEMSDYVEDIAAVIARLRLAPCILIGHSLGGLIALTCALRHGDMLSALVVVDMGPRLHRSRRMHLLSRAPTSIFLNEEDLFRRFRLLPEATWAAPELLHHIARHSARSLNDGRLTLKTDRATFVRQPHDVSTELSRLTCPTLLIRGGESETLSPGGVREMEARCSRLRTVEIPDAGHHVFLDKPAAFLEGVWKFLHEYTEEGACET